MIEADVEPAGSRSTKITVPRTNAGVSSPTPAPALLAVAAQNSVQAATCAVCSAWYAAYASRSVDQCALDDAGTQSRPGSEDRPHTAFVACAFVA